MARRRPLTILTVLSLGWLVWAAWFFWWGRGSAEFSIVDDSGVPVPGVSVLAGDEVVATGDEQGIVELSWRGDDVVLDLRAAGFRPTWFRPSLAGAVVEIEPYVLGGRVLDPQGRPVPGVSVRSGGAVAVSDRGGTFLLRGGEPGRVVAWTPAWTEGAWDWDGSPGALQIEIAPLVLKAVHFSGEVAASPSRWAELIDLTLRTELNAVMLDLKDETGTVFYGTQVGVAIQTGAVRVSYDLAEISSSLAEQGLYLIGRIVTFQDPIVATGIPAMAVTVDGEIYTKRGQSFLDPTDESARQYAWDLAVEACRLGVDEIQFDYIRFPDGFPEEAVFDGLVDEDSRIETIRSFLEEARRRLRPLGCAVAADVFGFTTTAQDDGGIGQKWDVIAAELDVVSPMLYPSHYGSGWYSYEDPQAFPAEVVSAALEDGLARLESMTIVRPWLQDFSYTASQVRAQIDAAEAFGLGWMLWNAVSEVSIAALR